MPRLIHYFFNFGAAMLLSLAGFAQVCDLEFELGNDTTINCNSTLTLEAPPGYTYLWNTGATTQTIDVTEAGTYDCTITETQVSVVENGDFSDGNTGFNTDYMPGMGGAWGLLSNEGEYTVVANSADAHTSFAFCYDHTTDDPSGSMLVVNGASFPELRVWYQTITVEPNTDYQFSIWAMTTYSTAPAQLNLLVGGTQIGTTLNLGAATCNWQNHTAMWNSGANTSVEIAIINQSLLIGGNDFAIDDIEFSQVCFYTDEIEVSLPVIPEVSVSNDTTICAGQEITLSATSDNPEATIIWQPGNLQSPSITVSPGSNQQYTAIAVSPEMCNSEPQDVLVMVVDPGNYQLEVPEFYTTCEGTPVDLEFETAGTGTYEWSPSAGLNNPNIGNPQATVSQDTEYTVTYTNACGVAEEATTTVLVSGGFIDLGEDLELCTGSTHTITLPAGPDYTWQDGATGNTYEVTASGTYTVESTVDNCVSTGSVSIIFIDSPQLVEIDDAEICAGDSYQVQLPAQPYTYLWDDGSTAPSHTFTEAGTYSVVASLQDCESVATFILEVIPLPVFDLGGPHHICEGTPLALGVGLPNSQVVWSTGATENTIQVTGAGTYTATVTVAGCSASDEVLVFSAPLPIVNIAGSNALCEGEVDSLSATAGDYSYLWSNGETENPLPVNSGGLYNVAVTDNQTGCIGTASINVVRLPAPSVSLPETMDLCTGHTDLILALSGNGSSLSWDDGTIGGSIEISRAGTYTVTATTECGSKMRTIEVEEIDCTLSLYIPNSFSPNGDGLNDLFKAIGQGISKFDMRVFDRWGSQVFATRDINTGWNGSRMNDNYFVEADLYVWIAIVEFTDGSIQTERGQVQLLR